MAHTDITIEFDDQLESACLMGYLNGGKVEDVVTEYWPMGKIFLNHKSPVNGAPLARREPEEQVGGRRIVIDLEHALAAKTEFLGRYQAINPEHQDHLAHAYFHWKKSVTSTVLAEDDLQQNSGKHARIKLNKSAAANMLKSVRSKYETVLMSDGTGDGGKQPLGLKAMIVADPTTGILGSLDKSQSNVASFWRNKVLSADPATFMDGNLGLYGLNELLYLCTFDGVGNEDEHGTSGLAEPDYLFVSKLIWLGFLNLSIEFKRLGIKTHSDLGFKTVDYAGVHVLPVPGLDAWAAETSTTYGIALAVNTNNIFLTVDPRYRFKASGWEKISSTQEDRMAKIKSYLQLCCDNLSHCGFMGVTNAAG